MSSYWTYILKKYFQKLSGLHPWDVFWLCEEAKKHQSAQICKKEGCRMNAPSDYEKRIVAMVNQNFLWTRKLRAMNYDEVGPDSRIYRQIDEDITWHCLQNIMEKRSFQKFAEI